MKMETKGRRGRFLFAQSGSTPLTIGMGGPDGKMQMREQKSAMRKAAWLVNRAGHTEGKDYDHTGND
jgi:hypothetical protein